MKADKHSPASSARRMKKEEVTASGENQETATFTVPEDAKSGDTIHIIMEGVDGGGTNPVAYQRVIVTVK